MSAQDIIDGHNQEVTEKEQAESYLIAREAMKETTFAVLNTKQHIDNIIAENNFNTIDATLKAAMLRWRAIFQTFLVSVNSDAEVKALYEID